MYVIEQMLRVDLLGTQGYTLIILGKSTFMKNSKYGIEFQSIRKLDYMHTGLNDLVEQLH